MNSSTALQLRKEIPYLNRRFQVVIPKSQDPYWLTHSVFAQLVAIDITPASDQQAMPVFKAHFKITSLDNQTLWKFFEKRKSQFEALIRKAIKEQSKERFVVREIKFYHGSIDVVIIFQLAISLIGMYPEIRMIVGDLINISSSLLSAFTLFFLGYAVNKPTPSPTSAGKGIAISIWAIIVFVILSLIIAVVNSTQQPYYEPPPYEQPPTTGPTQTTIAIINHSTEEICYVYIAPSTSDNWGEDWLGDSRTIPINQSQTFVIDPGTYDLKVDNCDRSEIATTANNNLQGSMEWVVE